MKLLPILKNVINEGSVKTNERLKLYEDERLLVVVPLSHKAACKYGSNTPWCVSTPSNDEHYNEYRKYGAFIFFIIKSPYQEAKIKEYKFAYYHPYVDDAAEEGGWYDMSDYHYVKNSNPESYEQLADMKLIKFLIPDHIFALVKQYLAENKKIFNKEQKNRFDAGIEAIFSDKDNHVIVNDNDWTITYRTKVFPEYFEQQFGWNRDPNTDHFFYMLYIDKKNKKVFEHKIPYYYDIRGILTREIDKRDLFSAYYIGTMNSANVEPVVLRYFKPISNAYFKCRQEFFKPSVKDSIYMPPQFVTTDDYYIVFREPNKITNIYQCNNRASKICIDTDAYKNIYYSDSTGVSIQYDAKRHNDPNLPKRQF